MYVFLVVTERRWKKRERDHEMTQWTNYEYGTQRIILRIRSGFSMGLGGSEGGPPAGLGEHDWRAGRKSAHPPRPDSRNVL